MARKRSQKKGPADDELKALEKGDTEPPAPPDLDEQTPDTARSGSSKPPAGGVLADEMAVRRHALAVCEALLPSKVGDEKFEWMTQGRSLADKKRDKLFSTCGELPMSIFYCLGYRGPCLNRELTRERDGVDRRYRFGLNMSFICGKDPRSRSALEGLWVPCRPLGDMPSLGDVVYVSNGPPRTEHVMVYAGQTDAEFVEVDVWHAGQGGKLTQHGEKARVAWDIVQGHRPVVRIGSRQVHGWVDVGRLVGKLTEPACMPPF